MPIAPRPSSAGRPSTPAPARRLGSTPDGAWGRIVLLAIGGLLGLAPELAGQVESVGITGVVVGEVGESLPDAEVQLRASVDSSVVAKTLTAEQGRFRISVVTPGRYWIRVSHLGFGPYQTVEVELAEGTLLDIGILTLSIEPVEMAPLLVTAVRQAVTFEADRTSYDLEAMGMGEGVSAAEAMATIPDLEVDLDGRISLRGAAPGIYLNGRPAPMQGEAFSVFLEQFPADHIERIEVIDNPSARYDAQGPGGIVNIVLREGVELGLTGSVLVNAGTRGQYGGGGRGTLQRGRWTLNGSISANASDRESSSYNLRQNLLEDPVTFRRQDTRSDRSGLGTHVSLDVAFEPGERTRFWMKGRSDGNSNAADGLITTTHLDARQDPWLRYDRMNSSRSGRAAAVLSTGFRYEWDRRHDFQLELQVQRGSVGEESREEVMADSLTLEEELVPAELTLGEQDEGAARTSLDADYARPWGQDGRIELGYKAELQDTDSERVFQLLDDPGTLPGQVEEIPLGFRDRQRFDALYLTLQRQVGRMGVQAGLRGERTDSRFEIPSGERFDNAYVSLFPSANLTWRLSRRSQIRLSYSRRIGRPSQSVLNPTDRSTDPLVRQVGNPFLEPQFTHSLMLNASWSGSAGSFRFSPYFRKIENDWAEITTVGEGDVFTRTWANVASQKSWGASASVSVRRWDRVNGNVSLSGTRQVWNATNLSADYAGNSLRWSSRANLDIRLRQNLTAQTRFSYSPPVDRPQGRSAARVGADLGFRYRLMDGRASVRLSLSDPFGLRRSSFQSQDATYLQVGHTRESTRSASVNVSYSFGGGSG